eukprot:1146208-Pelagomonas_calceolata.AAC.18
MEIGAHAIREWGNHRQRIATDLSCIFTHQHLVKAKGNARTCVEVSVWAADQVGAIDWPICYPETLIQPLALDGAAKTA